MFKPSNFTVKTLPTTEDYRDILSKSYQTEEIYIQIGKIN